MARWLLGGFALAVLVAASAGSAAADPAPALTAEQIVQRYTQARGGLEAWRKVQTMVWTGRIETGDPASPAASFIEEFKRPNKSRFEVDRARERSVRVFDGAYGWNLRSSATGAAVLRAYGPEQLRSAREAQGIDGILIDHQAKGIKVGLDGMEDVDGHRAYRLSVALPSGSQRHVWIDAKTFLTLKSESDSERHWRAGRPTVIEVRYDDYRPFGGLLIPTRIESGPKGGGLKDTMIIDDVTLNLSLSDARFRRPADPEWRAPRPQLQESLQSVVPEAQ
jgi:hypothetical protein